MAMKPLTQETPVEYSQDDLDQIASKLPFSTVADVEIVEVGTESVERGGAGSGHFGHEGRPGEVGGSLPGDLPPIGSSPTAFLVRQELEDARLPTSHYDGLDGIGFTEGTYVLTVGAEGISEAYGIYNPQTRTIRLAANPQPLVRPGIDMEDRAMRFGGNIAVYGGATILHEVGHHVHLARLTDEAAGEWAKLSRNGNSATISAYARTNQGEHFAEAYRAYARGGHHRAALRAREPNAYRFMRSLLRAESPRFLPLGTYPTSDWRERYAPR